MNANTDSYLNNSNMCSLGVWATDAELMATAIYTGCDIIVYAHFGATFKWLHL